MDQIIIESRELGVCPHQAFQAPFRQWPYVLEYVKVSWTPCISEGLPSCRFQSMTLSSQTKANFFLTSRGWQSLSFPESWCDIIWFFSLNYPYNTSFSKILTILYAVSNPLNSIHFGTIYSMSETLLFIKKPLLTRKINVLLASDLEQLEKLNWTTCFWIPYGCGLPLRRRIN